MRLNTLSDHYRYLLLFFLGAAVYTLYNLTLHNKEKSQAQNKFPVEIPNDHERLALQQEWARQNRPQVHIDIGKPVKHFLDGRVHFHLGDKEKRKVDWCHGNIENPTSAPKDAWQSLHLGSHDIYVYSAYYISVAKRSVRIIAIYRGTPPRALYCQLWYRGGAVPMRAASASLRSLPEGKGTMYNSAYINCENPVAELPYAVSLTFSDCQEAANIIPIEPPAPADSNLSSPPTGPLKIGLCVTPLNLNYDKIDQVIEYLEVTRYLGATHVTFYNYSTSPRVAKLLQTYEKKGWITVRQWPLPMKVHVWPVPPNYHEEIYYFGQIAALNDCLMRAQTRFHLAGFFDLGELAIPRKHRNWEEMMKSEQISGPNWKRGLPRQLTFLNTFFKLEWPSDNLMAANISIKKLHAASLLKTRREAMIFGVGQRSKLLLDPRLVDVMGVHNVWNLRSDAEIIGGKRPQVVVSSDLGLLHHYRFWDGMGDKNYVEDRTVLRLHREGLVTALQKAQQRIGSEILSMPAIRDEHRQFV